MKIKKTFGILVAVLTGLMLPQNMIYAEQNKIDSDKIIVIGASFAKGWKIKQIGDIEVINKGVGGETSLEMLSRFESDVLSLKPRWVIIWGFINDFFDRKKTSIEVVKDNIKKNYTEMIKLSRNNDVVPILMTELTIKGKDSISETMSNILGWILGKKSYSDRINASVIDINNWLKTLASKEKLSLLDIQPLLADTSNARIDKYANEDGVHISDAGYKKITEYTKIKLQEFKSDHGKCPKVS